MDGIEASGSFCVNVLSDQQSDLCWKFAKSGTDDTRFDGVEWHAAPSGVTDSRSGGRMDRLFGRRDPRDG